MDLDNLLQDIYNDISFSNEDVENIKQNTNRYISEELEKINAYLQKSVLDFTKKEIENMKKSKIDRFNKNINTITENTLSHIAQEFNLDKNEVLEKNKDNLLKINDFHKLYEQDLTINDMSNEIQDTQDTILESKSESKNESKSESKSESKAKQDKSNKTTKKKSITLDDTTENDNYKNHLISQNKCPAFLKGKYCCRPPKTGCGNYCGFHKKFNV